VKIYSILFLALALSNNAAAELFDHCNSLLQHGITNITRHQTADHAIAYKWHSNCGMDFDSSSDSDIKKASVSVFGYGEGDASGNTSHQRKKLKNWCDKNREFAQSNKQLYEEARVIADTALQAWNQCQEIAKKGVYISANPLGDHSDFVHFEIDSTLDADLRLFPSTSENYTCKTLLSAKEGDNKGILMTYDPNEQPMIKNANIHIDCMRKTPAISDSQGITRIKYAQAYVSVQTSGPSLQFYAPEVVDDYLSTPSGSVLAFTTNSCPQGWSEYRPAYGRFIRGLDKSGQNADPDGLRKIGSLQDPATALPKVQFTGVTTTNGEHYHANAGQNPFRTSYGNNDNRESRNNTGTDGTHSHKIVINGGGDVETRPKNVALLYCEKD